MDGTRFDVLAKLLAEPASRRSAVRSLGGGTLGAVLGLLSLANTEADKKKDKKKGKGKKKKKRGCPEDAVDCGGSCAGPGQCCPGEKLCGGGCISGDSCCPYTESECPNGSCVSIFDGCCSEAECGDCGTCLNGRCVEVPGICDTENCERCNTFSWTCEDRCNFNQSCDGGTCKCSGRQCGDTCCHAGAVGCEGNRCLNECDIRGDCGG